MDKSDKLVIAGHEFSSRFILGSGKYSMKLIEAAVKYAGAEIITLAVRRANSKEHESILDYIPKGVIRVLRLVGLALPPAHRLYFVLLMGQRPAYR